MNHYVYVVLRPDGTPCWVGAGSNDRVIKVAKYASVSCRSEMQELIAQNGGELPYIIVRDGISREEAFDAEKMFIEAFGRIIDGGTLLNKSTGGRGFNVGAPVTMESRYRRSIANTGNLRVMVNARKGAAAMRDKVARMSAEERTAFAEKSAVGVRRRWAIITPEKRAEFSAKISATRRRRR